MIKEQAGTCGRKFDGETHRKVARDEVETILMYSPAKPMNKKAFKKLGKKCRVRTVSRIVMLSSERIASLVMRLKKKGHLKGNVYPFPLQEDKSEYLFFKECLVLARREKEE